MTKSETANLLTLAVALGRRSRKAPAQIAADILALHRLGKRATTRALRACNDSSYQRFSRDGELLRAKVSPLAKQYRASAEITGDPRGYCLKLTGLGIWNTWGGEETGYGV